MVKIWTTNPTFGMKQWSQEPMQVLYILQGNIYFPLLPSRQTEHISAYSYISFLINLSLLWMEEWKNFTTETKSMEFYIIILHFVK
jgi:hypothetical protein